MKRKSLIERFEDKVIPVTESGCWLWIGTITEKGYGRFGVGGKMKRAHRVSYELFVGEIPDGLVIDHKCRVRCCVNPAHLEPVTNKENIRRGDNVGIVGRTIMLAKAFAKTHCPHGHPYSGDNLYLWENNKKKCRECRRVASKNYRLRLKRGSKFCNVEEKC